MLVGFFAVSSVGHAQNLQPTRWLSKHYADHPLVGTVWTGQGRQSSWSALAEAIIKSPYVLVGETHPNADHHLFQASVLQLLSQHNRRPIVVWEMVPQTMQPQLDALAQVNGTDAHKANRASDLGKQLNWSTSGWPPWSLYQPIAQAALDAKMPMLGAALARKTLMGLARSGLNTLDFNDQQRLHLTKPLPADAAAALLVELNNSHCNLLPSQALPGMRIAQRARDGAMASAMLNNETTDGAVLIAGNGHVRNDWAVPLLLNRAAPTMQTVSIAQFEVTPDNFQPLQYLRSGARQAQHDFVIFTPKSEIRDYCAELASRVKGQSKAN